MCETPDSTESEQESTGEWVVVDERPFECPNDCGLLKVETATSLHCSKCGYSRTVIEYVEDNDHEK